MVDGPDGILRTAAAGTVIAIHSTISDSTAVELAEVCAAAGVYLVDAPVSGGAPGAEKGELAVMVGGPRAVYEACEPAFALWAALPVHAGEVGAGTRMKLARNLLHFISFAATAEASRLAEAAGIDVAALGRVVRHTDAITGGAGAVMLRDTTAPIDPTTSGTASSRTSADWVRRTCRSPSAWPSAWTWTCRSAPSPCATWARASVSGRVRSHWRRRGAGAGETDDNDNDDDEVHA